MPDVKVGVQIRPQHASIAELRAAWKRADAMGADSIWTWDHFFPLSGEADGKHFEGLFILGVGSGWAERDYDEYGYDFKDAPARLRDLAAALPVMVERLGKLNPGPVNGKIPILIGGGGEKVTLRLVAQYADMWNGFGDPEAAGRKSQILDEWCAKIGRNPAEIERSVLFSEPTAVSQADAYVENGITHLIFAVGAPEFNFEPIEQLLAWRDSIRFNE